MPDREKVIKGLEILMNGCANIDCDDCYFYISTKPTRCGLREEQIQEDVLALLKEQKAVEPRTEPSAKGYWYTCGACGWWLFEVRDSVHFDDRKRIRFCASCGRPVKWE